MTEPFEMHIEEIWHLTGRPSPIVTGPHVSGDVRVGDRVALTDAHGTVHATVIGVELHVKAPNLGLMLSEIDDGSLRRGQVMRLAADG